MEKNYKNLISSVRDTIKGNRNRIRKNEEEIDKIEDEIRNNQNHLLNIYFNTIRAKYYGFDEEGKSVVEGRLEYFIRELDKLNFEQQDGKIKLFDGKTARLIRMGEGLNIPSLLQEIGMDTSGARASIPCYEDNRRAPGNPPRGKLVKKYLNWLKEHGYNPYGL